MHVFTLALAGDVSASTNLTTTNGLMNLLPMVAIFLVFYFLLIRPQMKNQKETQSMISTLKKGDKVIAAGGIIGKIIKIEDDIISLEVDTNSKIQVIKSSVADCLNKKPTDKK